MRRGELWLAEVGRKQRPVLLLTRSEVLDARNLVTVAEVTTSIRGLVAAVDVDHVEVGLERRSVVNCDGLHTVAQGSLTGPIGRVGDDIMDKAARRSATHSAADRRLAQRLNVGRTKFSGQNQTFAQTRRLSPPLR